jgi:hypothetical protein
MSERWRYWPHFVLRSTGFPYELLEQQRSPALGRALDALLDAEAALAAERERLLALFDHRQPLGQALGSDGTRVVFKALRAGRPVPDAGLPGSVVQELHAWNQKLSARESAHAEVLAALVSARADTRQALHRAVAREDLREAVFLSSREAWRRMEELRSVGQDEPRNRRVREKEMLAVSYLQRLCAKNDTISFFGPQVWGRIDETGAVPSLELRHGPDLVDRREVFYEHWGIESLAAALRADPEVLPHVTLELAPYLRFDGAQLCAPGKPPITLDPDVAAVLRLCDGQRSAGEVERLAGVDDALATVEALLDEAIVRDGLRVPTATAHPEDTLRQLVASLPAACSARGRWLERIDHLIALRDRFAGAPLSERVALAAEIEQAFVDVGGAAHRKAGQVMAGRDLFYEDCRRPVDLVLGPRLVERLRPLELLLSSQRWMVHEVARRHGARWRSAWQARAASGPVRFLDLVEDLGLLGKTAAREAEHAVAEDYRARWAEALEAPAGARRLDLTSDELARRLGDRFTVDGPPPYRYATLCAPDVQLAAASVDELRAGRFLVVLCENHVAWPGLTMGALAPFCPDRPALLALLAGDAPLLAHVTDHYETYHRAAMCPPAMEVLHEIETSRTPARVPPERRHRAADLVVLCDEQGQLQVTPEQGGVRLPLVEVAALNLSERVIRELPAGLLGGAHTPRVTVDGVVLQREQWSFAPAEVPAGEADAPHLLALRAWQKKHDVPDQVFVRIPEERKPFLVDFLAPLLVENFARLLRKASRVELTEMLPGPGELWLRDERGRYTSELRMTVEAHRGHA